MNALDSSKQFAILRDLKIKFNYRELKAIYYIELNASNNSKIGPCVANQKCTFEMSINDKVIIY